MRSGLEIMNNPKVQLEKAGPGFLEGTVKLKGDNGSFLYHFVFTIEKSANGKTGREHVSVSRKVGNKLPGWTEMCDLKDIFWKDEEECYQKHPKKSEYVNIKSNCLHIWRDVPEAEWAKRIQGGK